MLVVNTFESSRVELELDGQKVSLTQSSQFPRAGEGTLTFHMAKPATFGLLVRVPKWVQVPPWNSNFKLTVNDQAKTSTGSRGYAVVRPREWKDGDRVNLSYKLGPRLILGHFGNTDRAALAWGPFVLAYDQARNPGLPSPSAIGLVRESTELTIRAGAESRVPGAGRRPQGRQPKAGGLRPVRRRGVDWWRLPRLAACPGRGCQDGVGPGRRPGEPLAAGQSERLDHRRRSGQLRGHLRWLCREGRLVCRDACRAGADRSGRLQARPELP